MRSRILILLLSSWILLACDSRTVYSQYEAIPAAGWNEDSILHFDFTIEDTLNDYRCLIHVRHSETYPYQNMWLFVNNDTIEFYLADERGRWLGNGKNGLIEMPVLYEESVRFSKGEHRISIQQGMRDKDLRGISDIGVAVIKNK